MSTGQRIHRTLQVEELESRVAPATIYVDANVVGGSDGGSTWNNAFDELQEALGVAASGDEIWVADGTYTPDGALPGERTLSFVLKNGVALYGGFLGTEAGGYETVLSQRNWQNNVSILSGEIGTAGANDNTYHVVVGSGTDATAVLDGFSVCGGNASGTTVTDKRGAGMYSTAGSPTVTNCIFSSNIAVLHGGGMLNDGSSPTVTNCTFSENFADSGGGMYNDECSPIVTDCLFSNNVAESSGGGVENSLHCYPTITNCVFSANRAEEGQGGGVSNYYSSATITNCLFVDNYGFNGGGMGSSWSSTELVNCTFVANSARFGPGGVSAGGSSPVLTNCIIYNNSGGLIEGYSGGTPVLAYCNIEGSGGSGAGWGLSSCIDGGGNIDDWPRFVNPSDPDGPDNLFGTNDDGLRLAFGSPCIDAATSTGAPVTDILGAVRPQGVGHDMGTYEGGYPDTYGHLIVHCTPDAIVTDPVSFVDVVFNEAIKLGTFDVGDALVTGPSGTIATSSISPQGGNTYRITFSSAQSAQGTYHVYVGPNIEDLAGNLMDQDQDGIQGENPDDIYDASFTIAAPGTQTIFQAINFDGGIGAQVKTFMTGVLGAAGDEGTWDTFEDQLDDDTFGFSSNTTAGFKLGVKGSITVGEGIFVDLASVGWGMSVAYDFADDYWTISRGFEAAFLADKIVLAGSEYLSIPGTSDGRPIIAGVELTKDYALDGGEVSVGIDFGLISAVSIGSIIGVDSSICAETYMSEAEFLSLTGQGSVAMAALDSFGFVASGWLESVTDALGRVYGHFGRTLLSSLGQSDDPLGLMVQGSSDITASVKSASTAEKSLGVNVGLATPTPAIGAGLGVYAKVFATTNLGVTTEWQETYSRAELQIADDVGNSRAEATNISPWGVYSFYIEPTDKDYFAFDSATGQKHNIWVFSDGGAERFTVQLTNADGDVLRRTTANDCGWVDLMFEAEEAGQCFVSVEGNSKMVSGMYNVYWDPGTSDGTFSSGLTGYNGVNAALVDVGGGNYAARLTEHSPASLTAQVDVPCFDPYLNFDYRMVANGDGDQLEARVYGTTIWSATISGAGGAFTNAGPIDLSAYAGESIRLEFYLRSVGGANAAVDVDNIAVGGVPEYTLYSEHTARATVYDFNRVVTGSLDDFLQVRWGKDGKVISVSLCGESSLDGVGIAITGATSVNTILDRRRGDLGNITFIACNTTVNIISVKSAITGRNLNGLVLDGMWLFDDIDGDGFSGDTTAIYSGGPVRMIRVLGPGGFGVQAVSGDIVVLGADRQGFAVGMLDVRNGGVWGDVVTLHGGIRNLRITGGDYVGQLSVHGDLQRMSVRATRDKATGFWTGGSFNGTASIQGCLRDLSLLGGSLCGRVVVNGADKSGYGIGRVSVRGGGISGFGLDPVIEVTNGGLRSLSITGGDLWGGSVVVNGPLGNLQVRMARDATGAMSGGCVGDVDVVVNGELRRATVDILVFSRIFATEIGSVMVRCDVENSTIHAGGSFEYSAPWEPVEWTEGHGSIRSVNIRGYMCESNITAGVWLGDDGLWGGAGASADTICDLPGESVISRVNIGAILTADQRHGILAATDIVSVRVAGDDLALRSGDLPYPNTDYASNSGLLIAYGGGWEVV